MKIRYVGPHSVVEIAATGQTVERGGTVDVDDDVAEALCLQDCWQQVKSRTKSGGED